MATITVIGKADLGYSPKFGEIRKGQEYSIEETEMADELFELPPVISKKKGKED